jgi:flagellar basal body rod protein FlgG
MHVNPVVDAALDSIAQRAQDVRRAFTPGAAPRNDDVAKPQSASQFALDPLSVAPPGEAYFVVGGDGGPAYTRDGALRVQDGILADAAGCPVLGKDEASDPLRPLQIDPVDVALGRAGDPHVEADGSFVYMRAVVDPRSGAHEVQRVVVGRLALARFPAGTRLGGEDAVHVAAPGGVVPHVGLPGNGSFAPLQPMRRERSRVDLDESLIRLKEAYLAFDALQAAETAKGRLGKTAMDLLK